MNDKLKKKDREVAGTYEHQNGEEEMKKEKKKRKKNVPETINSGCDGCFRCLSLSLRPLWHSSPCRETPVTPYSNPRSSSPFPERYTVHYQQITRQTNPNASEHPSPAPEPVPSQPPLPVWAIPRHPWNRTVVRSNKKPDLEVAPYEWATRQRAIVHKLDYLRSREILLISGKVQCKRCKRSFVIQYDLLEKFKEIGDFINQNESSMLDRAPSNWMSPTLPNCRYCRAEKCVAPYNPKRKRSINWLFLFLGEMIGCCNLMELRYFCKLNDEIRTGAKDRVVYSTYLELCKQLDPTGESFLSLIKSHHEQP